MIRVLGEEGFFRVVRKREVGVGGGLGRERSLILSIFSKGRESLGGFCGDSIVI